MNTTKILESEIADMKISSLPSRPTAPTAFGGKGFTANEMKAAFDKLPLYIIERFNMLLSDIEGSGEGSLAAAIPTKIADGHTLSQLFLDICDGVFASYLSLGDETLEEMKSRLLDEKESFEERIAYCLTHIADSVIDGSSPSSRNTETGEVLKID